MLEAKPKPAVTVEDPTTTQYVDRVAAEGQPITLRIDDRAPLVVKDERTLRMLVELIDRIETIEAVEVALEQSSRGEGRPAEQFFAEMREKYGPPTEE
jgi:hypothetical protein